MSPTTDRIERPGAALPLTRGLPIMAPRTSIGTGAPRHAVVRLAQVGTAFVALYLASNHLTSLRSDIGSGVFEWERSIPFVEASVLPYLSIFGLFVFSFFACRDRDELERHCARLLLALAVSIVCYALFPLRYEFQRPEPAGPVAVLLQWLWHVDLPFNRAPSLHISVMVLLWARFLASSRGGWRFAVHAWMAAIGLSVLTTYQHHVIDVASGLAVGAACLAVPAAWLQRLQGVDRPSPGACPAGNGARSA